MDDDLGPLRESVRSPSSGEVCLEVYSRQCSLCLHLFFSTVNLRFEILHSRLIRAPPLKRGIVSSTLTWRTSFIYT